MPRDRRDDEYDDDDDRPRRRPSRDDEEDEDRPSKRRSSRDEDEDRPRRRSGRDYGGPPAGKKLNVFGLISLILSIPSILVTIFLGCCYGWIPGSVGGLVSLVLGVVGISQAKKSDGEMGGGLAIAGTILGAITVIFSVLWGVFFAAMFGLAATLPTRPTVPFDGGSGNPVSATDPVDASVTAEGIAQEFQAGRDAADLKYTGKIVEVTGVIERVVSGDRLLGNMLYLKASGESTVHCEFGDNRTSAVEGLRAGQRVTIRGRYKGRVLSDPQLKDCVVIPGGPKPGPGPGGGAGLKVNVSTLAKAFAENPVKAAADYEGKTLEVSGQVWKKNAVDFGGLYIDLGGAKSEVQCQFDDGEKDSIIGLGIRSQHTIRGKCAGVEDGLVILEDCKLVQ